MERSQVDERFPLCYYFRAANQIVRQAKVYRKEGNIDDLYLAVTRYLRLMTEIIPQHRGYSGYSSKEKLHHRKIVQEFTKELKRLKPVSGIKENDTSKQPSRWSKHTEDDSCLPSQRCSEDDSCLPLQRCSANNQAYTRSYSERKVNFCKTIGTEGHSSSMESIKFEDGNMRNARTTCLVYQTAFPVALTVARDHNINVNVVRHYFPSPLLSCTESLPLVGHVSHFTIPESRNQYLESRCKESSTSRAIQDVHISARLMEEFMELARANTDKNLETCGILGAFLKNQTFYATTLIVPKQESTCNSCQALNEEEIYAVLDQQSLFPLGWIHTHPSQTCFLSSIDVHTQYSYQVMVPEAVAIVMAPTDPTRSYGIFRLTDPGGITILRECEEKGFHPHPETADGSPIYESCSNVYINPNLRFEIIDLRSSSLEI